jgi:cytochrome c peroxidase
MAGSGLGIASAAVPPAELRLEALQYTNSLRTLRRPEPPDLARYVVDRAALLRLGKALFWDEQVGSDRQACATCHYHAGADSRSRNQLNPGFLDTHVPGGDVAFGNSPLAPAALPAFGPNHQLTRDDFPLHRLADPRNAASAVLSDTNDVVSSQGVFAATFGGLDAAGDVGSPAPAGVFAYGDARVRNVEPRQTPSSINAVFNKRNFWDGRARSEFNGANPIGILDPGARVVNVAGAAQLVSISIADASLASQASGPALSPLEMSFAGRRFADLGRKLLSPAVGVLAQQLVAPDDGVLGPHSNQRIVPQVRGTSLRYADLVRQAFAPEWWNGGDARVDLSGGAPVVVGGGGTGPDLFTAMEYNFSLFFALAITEYERTLVSDDTPFDRFMEGDLGALDARQQAGLEVFIGPGKCASCHKGPALTSAAIPVLPFGPQEIIERMIIGDIGAATGLPRAPGVLPDLAVGAYDNGFYNIGVRPTREDVGGGAVIGPLSLPVSEVARAQACVRGEVGALVAAGTAKEVAIRQANASCKVPRALARGVEAAQVLRVVAQRLANPPAAVVLIEQASNLLAAAPVAANFAAAHAALEQARQLLAASPAVTPAVEVMLNGARLLLPDPVDPGADLLRPWGPPLEPDERILVDGTFKTPGLRNVELTAPYFHNGGQATLEQVIDFYNRGGDFAATNRVNLATDIVPLQLFPQQEDDLVAFLKALTDERVRHDRAPFDHPSLSIPNGGTPGRVTALAGMAVLDDRFELPAVGAPGSAIPLGSVGTAFASFPDALVGRLAAHGGSGQSAAPGASLPAPLVARVTDGSGNPLAGVWVSFAAPAGAAVSPTRVATGADGNASATATLATSAGAQTFSVSAAGVDGSPAAFVVQAVPLASPSASSSAPSSSSAPAAPTSLDLSPAPAPDPAAAGATSARGGCSSAPAGDVSLLLGAAVLLLRGRWRRSRSTRRSPEEGR